MFQFYYYSFEMMKEPDYDLVISSYVNGYHRFEANDDEI